MAFGDHHVYPVNDLIAHDTDGGECVCGPEVEPVKRDDGSIAYLVVHHSLDGREMDETPLKLLEPSTSAGRRALGRFNKRWALPRRPR